MAITKSDIPDLLLPGLRTEFELAYRTQLEGGVTEKLATIINTTQPVQKYPWLGASPSMREFVDERRPKGIAQYVTSIQDKTFEATIAVERNAIEDDQLDIIRLRIRDLAMQVSAHRHQLVVQTLLSGDSAQAYDGQSFFGIHPGINGSAQNLLEDELSAVSLADAMSKMMSFSDDSGTPLGMVPDTLVVGPELMWTAIELVESPVVVFKGSGTNAPTPYKNVFNGRLNLVVSPYINGVNARNWFVLDTSRPVKAVIMQQRSDVPIEFSALDNSSGSESAFMRDRYYYGVRGRYNVGYGLWQAAVGSFLG